MNRRTDDGTYPNVEEERLKIEERALASSPQLPRPDFIKVEMSAVHALDMLGELSDGYGPEANHAYDILHEVLSSCDELVKYQVFKDIQCEPLTRLIKALAGRPL